IFFIKQKTAYEIFTRLEFRRVLFRSHFAVTRRYNEATGEQRNIVEENDADRPWYEREYMRVAWSKSLATDSYDFDTLSMLGVLRSEERRGGKGRSGRRSRAPSNDATQ